MTIYKRQEGLHVIFIDEQYSTETDAVGLGRARPLRRAGRAKRFISVSLMLSRCPVIKGMKWSLIASSSGWRSDNMSSMVQRKKVHNLETPWTKAE